MQPRQLKRPPLRRRLDRSFYDRPTPIVARELLGKALLRRLPSGWAGGVIVETEAYLSDGDPACHADRGLTPGNATMFARPGTLYVYPIHAKHCMNAVTESRGRGSAVLIRAIEPVWGIESIQTNRGQQQLRRLTRGPGMLCQALQVDRSHDGIDLIRNPTLIIAAIDQLPPPPSVATPRIGISKACEALLRFAIAGNRFVSGKTL